MISVDLKAATHAELEEGLRLALINNHSQDIGRIMAELNRRSVIRFRARNPRWPFGEFALTDAERRELPKRIDPQTGFVDGPTGDDDCEELIT